MEQWNDYGESHYIGPLSSPHIDDGNSKWTNDMFVPHLISKRVNVLDLY